jgi:hypothetical protein
VAVEHAGQGTHVPACARKKTMGKFAKSPLAFGDFSWTFENSTKSISTLVFCKQLRFRNKPNFNKII